MPRNRLGEPFALHYTLDAEGNPVPCADVIAWARWFETADRRVCADYDEGDPDKRVMVSTVFLGLDHSFTGGPPVLWETLVFAAGLAIDGRMNRYTSREAAILGHQDVCAEVEAFLREQAKDAPHG